ncbi:MAG: hypothetical protein U9P36_14280 [Thermodesulfobacteriota bacterium]|nr:hypothetical protein [Thermodesulfobacteriota bacterium]
MLIFRSGLTELIEQVSEYSEAASVTSYVEDFVIEDRSKMA